MMDYMEYDRVVDGMPEAVWARFDAAHDEEFKHNFDMDSREFLARWLEEAQ